MIEQRRFPRIHLKKKVESTSQLDQAFAHWRNLELSEVYDLSLGGVAVSKPTLMQFYEDDLLDFNLELGSYPIVPVVAKVAWVGELSVGLSFVRLEAEGHLILRKFMNEKVIGSHLRLMNREYHAKDADFDFWYTGPSETHVFLKTADPLDADSLILQAEVVLDGDHFVFKDGVIKDGAALRGRVQRILESASESESSLKNFLSKLQGLK